MAVVADVPCGVAAGPGPDRTYRSCDPGGPERTSSMLLAGNNVTCWYNVTYVLPLPYLYLTFTLPCERERGVDVDMTSTCNGVGPLGMLSEPCLDRTGNP